MSKPPKDDEYSEEETKRRAEQALKGAFKTPPIPLPAPKRSPSKKAK